MLRLKRGNDRLKMAQKISDTFHAFTNDLRTLWGWRARSDDEADGDELEEPPDVAAPSFPEFEFSEDEEFALSLWTTFKGRIVASSLTSTSSSLEDMSESGWGLKKDHDLI
jgi:hypothetical protein